MTSLSDLRVKMIRELNYTNFFGQPKAYVDLEPQQQIDVWWRMKHYIVSYPSEFTPAQVESARASLAREGTAPTLADTSVGATISEFGSAFADEVVKKTTIGGNVLKNALYLAVILGAFWVWFHFLRAPKFQK